MHGCFRGPSLSCAQTLHFARSRKGTRWEGSGDIQRREQLLNSMLEGFETEAASTGHKVPALSSQIPACRETSQGLLDSNRNPSQQVRKKVAQTNVLYCSEASAKSYSTSWQLDPQESTANGRRLQSVSKLRRGDRKGSDDAVEVVQDPAHMGASKKQGPLLGAPIPSATTTILFVGY